MVGAKARTARGAPCAVCRKPAVPDYRPFCSRRCADVDLARWLGGHYAIPADPIGTGEDPDEALAPPHHPGARSR